MKEEEKRKILISSIIIIITLILVVVGTTYAYFSLQIQNSSEPTNIEITAGEANEIVLSGGIEGFHINVNANDMAYANKGKEYYGTDGEEGYVTSKEAGTKELGRINIKGKLEEEYTCTAIVNIGISEEMQRILQKGDIILVLIQGEREREIDLAEKRNPIIEFEIEDEKEQTIEAYIKLTNQDKDQSYIAGNKFNVEIKIEELKCEVGVTKRPILKYLRNNDKRDNLSNIIQGDMYRYQGTKDMVDNNYICFGTDNEEECKKDEDKYMYRIIGIDKEDRLKLIKETFIKEDNNRGFAWNDTQNDDVKLGLYCPNGVCPDWSGSTIFKRINGISNGTIKGTGTQPNNADTDIFVDSEEYEYLKSGDKINGGESASPWYNIIENHNWLYGETKEFIKINKYNAELVYKIESGQEATWQSTIVNGKATLVQKTKWEKRVESKIGLMYIHDLLYSYYDGKDESTRGVSSSESILNSWMHFLNNKLNTNNYNEEWPMTRGGAGSFGTDLKDESEYEGFVFVNNALYGISIRNDGLFGHSGAVSDFGIRPVFYLINTIELTGKGTTESPFIIHITQ